MVARVTPRATTAWFAVVHDRIGYRQKIVDRAMILIDDDGDGIVQSPIGGAYSASLWMVVDLTNGEYAVEAADHQTPVRRRPLTPAILHSRGNGGPARLLQAMPSMIVWVARPGVGVWAGSFEDGSLEDGDGLVDGNVAAFLERMTPIGNSPPPPDDFRRHDVVAIIDPATLALLDGRVVK